MRRLALLLSVTLLQAAVVRAQALPPTRDQILGLLSTYLDTLRAQSGIPDMAAAIVGDSDVLWDQGFGRDPETSVATPPDELFHFDGLTELFTASIVLRCVDQHKLSLDQPVRDFEPSSQYASATVAQVLTHTQATSGGLIFIDDSQRLDTLRFVVETCTGVTFRQAVRAELEQLGMLQSIPGPDAASTDLKNADIAPPDTRQRYQNLLGRLAAPYAVNAQLATTSSRYTVTTLGAASGLISNVLDFARFDLALRNNVLLSANTLAMAWSNPVNSNNQPLPHGMGWFVQTYNGEPVVWQFGVQPNAASSLVVTLPNRQITLILLANSDGLAQPSSLGAGDVTVSPFARVFLGLVVK